MSGLFLLFCLLALLHFVYERLLLPSIRLRLRFRLFAIRDALRWLKINDEVDQDSFVFLESAINNVIRTLHHFDAATIYASNQRLANDEGLRRRVARRIQVQENCANAEFQRLRETLLSTATSAVLANNGTWFFYLVPILLFVICCNQIRQRIKAFLSVPEAELEKNHSSRRHWDPRCRIVGWPE